MIDFTEMGAQRLSGLGNGAACHQELRGSSAAGLDIVFEFIPGFMWGDLQKICGLKLVFVSCYLLPAECTCEHKEPSVGVQVTAVTVSSALSDSEMFLMQRRNRSAAWVLFSQILPTSVASTSGRGTAPVILRRVEQIC
jgi:hypothetical protein